MNAQTWADVFKSPQWWVTTVIVAVLVNIASAFLFQFVEKHFSNASKWLSTRSKKQRQLRAERIKDLMDDPTGQILRAMRAVFLAVAAGVVVLISNSSVPVVCVGIVDNHAPVPKIIIWSALIGALMGNLLGTMTVLKATAIFNEVWEARAASPVKKIKPLETITGK